MRIRNILIAAATLVMVAACNSGKTSGPIKVNVPARPAGQENVLGLTVPAMDTVRIGFIGLGARGPYAVERYTYIPGVKIVALCDVIPDNVEKVQKALENRGFPRAAGYSGDTEVYKQLCERDDIDLVYICTDWVHHTPIALYAMEHGKNVACEVPMATSLEEIWALINMSEKTRKHCMMLENCCYDFFEMSCLAMAQAGVFGEVLHVEGSYLHYLDPYWGGYWNNWRLDFNQKHKGDVYPTHGLGPIAQVLGIHRGDRFKTLVAMDTKPANGPRAVKRMTGQDGEDFQNGDETSTMIRTENGKTILIEHDVLTPRPYDRMYQIVGSHGFAEKYPVERIVLRADQLQENPASEDLSERHLNAEEMAQLQQKYRSPILTPELEELAKKVGGHGGMDFIMDYRLIYCLRNGLPLDMDVYDMAEWCCLAELGAISIEHGSMPVEVPDFTRGAWNQLKGFSYALAK
ncbi:MAG: Gfo/Idh/MocA family oxidoreductase [Bacteroidales bacterium]|nr:Gfo/Idh/MocA family oxidoreductase [Bacteroidales bacterium]